MSAANQVSLQWRERPKGDSEVAADEEMAQQTSKESRTVWSPNGRHRSGRDAYAAKGGIASARYISQLICEVYQ